MTDQPIGQMLDALGVTIAIDEGQQLTEVMVIGKIIDFTDNESGQASLVIGKSGIDWITQRGLLSAAQHVLDSTAFIETDDD